MDENHDKEQREYEERLQRRLKILKEKFEQGNIHINPGLKVIDSLKAVRYAPDGSVDLNTVDGLVRSLALAVETMHDREELKGAFPLQEIQSIYFEFIERNLGQFFDIMRERGLTAHDAGSALSEKRSLGRRSQNKYLISRKRSWNFGRMLAMPLKRISKICVTASKLYLEATCFQVMAKALLRNAESMQTLSFYPTLFEN